jgi:membrane-bound inhibitor of C-type lysozyme
MRRLSIVAVAVAAPIAVAACIPQEPIISFQLIPRPAPEDPVPMGITYLCENHKEVSVVYAKNRATVTFADKTWRMEYQGLPEGFRYADANNQWTGRDDLAALRENAANRPLAYNCRPIKRNT